MVCEYFKKEFEGFKILVQVNPVKFNGLELTISGDGNLEKRKLQFDKDIFDDLKEDGFQPSGALEFNVYLNGLA